MYFYGFHLQKKISISEDLQIVFPALLVLKSAFIAHLIFSLPAYPFSIHSDPASSRNRREQHCC